MSDTQTITSAAPETGKAHGKHAAQGQRYTPLRSYVIARTLSRGGNRDLAHSPIVPARRLRYSA